MTMDDFALAAAIVGLAATIGVWILAARSLNR